MNHSSISLIENDATNDCEHDASFAEQAFADRKYGAAVARASSAIDVHLDKVVQLLNIRAKAWAKSGYVQEELHDISAMLQYAPSNPTGYLYAGNRYMMQGLQLKALEILDQGLCKVSHAHPQYNLLAKAKEQAQIQQNKRIDILARVPYEIMANIVDRIPQADLLYGVAVSKAWRQKLLDYPGCWRRIENWDLPRLFRILPFVSHHIQELCVAHEDESTEYLEFVRTGSFPNIRSFLIDGEDGKTKHYNFIATALSNVANNLTSLELGLPGDDTPHLYTFLKMCRNLTAVRFSAWSNPKAFIGSTLPYTTSLTSAMLATGEFFSASDIRWFFQCSPHIVRLDILGCDADVLEDIDRYLPDVNVVLMEGEIDLERFVKQHSAPAAPGIRVLEVHEVDLSVKSYVRPMLEKHRGTLQELRLRFDEFPSRFELSSVPLVMSELSSLTKLSLNLIPMMVLRELAGFLGKCQNLESFHLGDTRDVIPNNVFTALAKLQRLSKLVFKSALFSGLAMQNFLEAQAERNSEQCLKALTLYSCIPMTYKVAISCTSIKTLTYLELAYSEDHITRREHENVREAAAQIPNIRTWHVDRDKFFTVQCTIRFVTSAL